MSTKIYAFLIALSLFLGVCFAAAKPITDDAIVDQVRLRLSADAIAKGAGFTVDCKDGVVTIDGAAENSQQKDRATLVAKKVKGVKRVINNLTVGDRKSGK
jgi:hyperosmotically inducible protein